jgi:hypothetical protein
LRKRPFLDGNCYETGVCQAKRISLRGFISFS